MITERGVNAEIVHSMFKDLLICENQMENIEQLRSKVLQNGKQRIKEKILTLVSSPEFINAIVPYEYIKEYLEYDGMLEQSISSNIWMSVYRTRIAFTSDWSDFGLGVIRNVRNKGIFLHPKTNDQFVQIPFINPPDEILEKNLDLEEPYKALYQRYKRNPKTNTYSRIVTDANLEFVEQLIQGITVDKTSADWHRASRLLSNAKRCGVEIQIESVWGGEYNLLNMNMIK